MDASSVPVAPLPDLLAWYDRARRTLPWRALPGARMDAWAVLVSEIMLQQTTVATVKGRFSAFLDRFPTPPALAAASMDEVLHAWQGLGYYRRARALKACADALTAEHGGAVPPDLTTLLQLPGLGPYTARAVAAIAFGQPVVPVDANVARVLGRLIGLELPPAGAARQLQAAADTLADPARPDDVAQALMELGALVCTPRAPSCLLCPWQEHCAAFASGQPELYPGRPVKKEREVRFAVAFVLERSDGAILFRRRPDSGILAGMMEIPSTPWQPAPPDEAEIRRAASGEAHWEALPGEVRHLFTHLDLSIRLLRGRLRGTGAGGIWAAPEEFGELALPTLTVKLLRHARVWPGAGSKGSR
ncbi:A/G-specific adenine glycosylase [Geminicoccus roseus]|uniref:A/G-specific adenine glycosylase n=1 Tax=Geminicoccus roseus TaxID=404900 RepID=UPI00041EBE01|nr:A/G-specific adenine glycosylase [Geminicoccus roseus]